eukprot:scaffold571727_cov50-Prasinocladus_malaysianus.AAC.1
MGRTVSMVRVKTKSAAAPARSWRRSQGGRDTSSTDSLMISNSTSDAATAKKPARHHQTLFATII